MSKKTASHSLSKKILQIVLLFLVLILGFFAYRSYRASFIYPVHMQEEGVFQAHPDNAYPDKMADSPRDFLE